MKKTTLLLLAIIGMYACNKKDKVTEPPRPIDYITFAPEDKAYYMYDGNTSRTTHCGNFSVIDFDTTHIVKRNFITNTIIFRTDTFTVNDSNIYMKNGTYIITKDSLKMYYYHEYGGNGRCTIIDSFMGARKR